MLKASLRTALTLACAATLASTSPAAAAVHLYSSAADTAGMQTETPGQADAFVDSFGVDSRYAANSAEVHSFSASTAALYASGIRHLRDGNSTTFGTFQQFGTHGIKHSIGFGLTGLTAATINAALQADGPNVDFVEASNEYDNSGDPNWAATLRAAQTLLYNTVRANPANNNIAVLAPSLDSPKDAPLLGQVPADGGNLHNATCDFNPATTQRSVAMAPQAARLQPITPGKPIWTTETGYDNNTASSCYISEDGAAKYIPRTMAFRYNSGMPRSYFDSWSDESGTEFANMGLVSQSGVPKKQYYAVQSLLELLSDPGPSHPTANLTYAFTGATANVMHTLLQKRHGTYYLLIWQEVTSWNHNLKAPIVVPPAQVTITFNGATSPGVFDYAYQPNYSLTRVPLVGVTRKSITINVTDSIQVLQFSASS